MTKFTLKLYGIVSFRKMLSLRNNGNSRRYHSYDVYHSFSFRHEVSEPHGDNRYYGGFFYFHNYMYGSSLYDVARVYQRRKFHKISRQRAIERLLT